MKPFLERLNYKIRPEFLTLKSIHLIVRKEFSKLDLI